MSSQVRHRRFDDQSPQPQLSTGGHGPALSLFPQVNCYGSSLKPSLGYLASSRVDISKTSSPTRRRGQSPTGLAASEPLYSTPQLRLMGVALEEKSRPRKT